MNIRPCPLIIDAKHIEHFSIQFRGKQFAIMSLSAVSTAIKAVHRLSINYTTVATRIAGLVDFPLRILEEYKHIPSSGFITEISVIVKIVAFSLVIFQSYLL